MKATYNQLQAKFGQNLKKLREDKGLSLMDLAVKINSDDSYLSKIENGKKNIQLSTIFELAKGLELEPKELLNFYL